jgi:hypothetical protein
MVALTRNIRRRVEPTSKFYQPACSPLHAKSLCHFTLMLRVTGIICQCKNTLSRMLCSMLHSKATRMAQLVEWLGYKLTEIVFVSRQEFLCLLLVSVGICSQTYRSHTNVVNQRIYLHVVLWFGTRGYISLSPSMPSCCRKLQLLWTVSLPHLPSENCG